MVSTFIWVCQLNTSSAKRGFIYHLELSFITSFNIVFHSASNFLFFFFCRRLMNFLRNYLLSTGTKLSPCVSRQLQCPTVTTGHNLLITHSMSSQYKPEQVLHDATKQEFYLEMGGERWDLVNLIFNLGCGACNCDVITNQMLKFLMFNIITTMGWNWVIQRASYLSQAVRS